MRLGQTFIKQKLRVASVLEWAVHIFGSVIQVWKALGPMFFWSFGQRILGKVYKTKVVVHFSNYQLGQALTSHT